MSVRDVPILCSIDLDLASHLNDVKKPMDRAWLAISLSLPLRPEEVLGLQWADIDEETCTIHVRNTVTHPTRNVEDARDTALTDYRHGLDFKFTNNTADDLVISIRTSRIPAKS